MNKKTALIVFLFILGFVLLMAALTRAQAGMWCAWNDWSSHDVKKCSVHRDGDVCEKNAKKNKWGDCTSWMS